MLTYALSVSPAGMSISANGPVTWTPGSTGTFAVTIRVTDGHGGTRHRRSISSCRAAACRPIPSTVAPTTQSDRRQQLVRVDSVPLCRC